MRKTLTLEFFIALLFTSLGILGMFLLNGIWQSWILPVYTAIILLAYVIRWEFVISAGILMPLITTLLNNNNFKIEQLIVFILEVIITGILIYFSYNKWNFNIHGSLVFGILAGRISGGILAWLIHMFFIKGTDFNLYDYVINSIEGDIKGIALQLALVPFIVLLFNKIFVKTNKKR